jgi:hypothetical protein
MDNHPIPQDVTGFQFRLIGNMTVKQFAYVAVGAVSAVIIFYLPLFILLKILFIPLFIIGGVVLAFIPVEGRPIDIMVTNFFKAVFSPTQFLYHREGGHLLLSTIHIEPRIVTQAASGVNPQTNSSAQRDRERQQQLSAYLNSIHQNQPADEKEATRLSSLFGQSTTTAAAMPSPMPAMASVTPPPSAVESALPLPSEPVLQTTPLPPVDAIPVVDAGTAIQIEKDKTKIAEEETLMQQVKGELTRAKAAEQTAAATPQPAEGVQLSHTKVTELEAKLQQIMDAKTQLEQELLSLRSAPPQKVITTPAVPTVPVTAPVASPVPVPAAAPVNAKPPAKGSFPSIPDSPNILLGIVRDSSGNVLPNILVEVTDTEGNPVRAFKTNQLGQFMSATQLKAGHYTIIFEDSKNLYKFDPLPIEVTDQIIQPLEVAAHDAREALRKSLFA